MAQTNQQNNNTNRESLADRKKAALWHWSHLIYQAALEASVATADYAAAIERVKKATQELRSLHSNRETIPGVTRYLGPKTSPEFALKCWAKTLYDAALQACEETDAYVGGDGNIQYARTVVDDILRKAEQELKGLGGSQTLRATPAAIPAATPTAALTPVPAPTPTVKAGPITLNLPNPQPVLQALGGSSPCNDDQQCPDNSICVENYCEPL